MSFEAGGRSDKRGNTYENHFLATLLLRLLDGTYISIQIEPLGDEGKGVEFIATSPEGIMHYYQCKGSNGSHSYWRASDLSKLKVFQNAEFHLSRTPNNEYHFISPCPYNERDELCNRARSSSSCQDFINHQLSNAELRAAISDFEQQWNLNRTVPTQLNQLFDYLKRCRFELISFNAETILDQERTIGMHFIGDTKAIRELLWNCVNDNQWYGQQINSTQIKSYINDRGYPTRNYGSDPRIWARIDTLNELYYDKYNPIGGSLFHRIATDDIIHSIENNHSVILHGKAGVGKSGCIEEVVQILKNKNIPYLRIKLDKFIPCTSPDMFGQALDLPESPVHCLHKVSGQNTCVLILDQLDSLRWNYIHSPSALNVCKEMIYQMQQINHFQQGKICILCVTRTFDYKNEQGIASLFSIDATHGTNWKEIELHSLSEEETANIVGERYTKLSTRLKSLLSPPSNLFVWSKLDEIEQTDTIVSVNQLMEKWWNKILNECEKIKTEKKDVIDFVNQISTLMNSKSTFSLPQKLFSDHSAIITGLISNGLLVDSSDQIKFTHQSFLDYFLSIDFAKKIYLGELTLIKVAGSFNEQTLNLRYRILSVIRSLLDFDEKTFLAQSEAYINSDEVRYYYKCAVFEIISQLDSPSASICDFVIKHTANKDWHDYVLSTVVYGNPNYISHFDKQGAYNWLSDDGLNMLESIVEKDPDFFYNKILLHCFKDEENDKRIISVFSRNVSDESELLYNLRLRFLKRYPQLLVENWFNFYNSFTSSPLRCIDYIQLCIIERGNIAINNIHLPEEKVLAKFASENALSIIENIYPTILNATEGLSSRIDEIVYSDDYTMWADKTYQEGPLRKFVEIVKIACQTLAQEYPEQFIELLNAASKESLVENELLLAGIEQLPISFANNCVAWLIKSFPNNIFDYTGSPNNYLTTAKRILEKFTPFCSMELFQSIENLIAEWKDDLQQMIRIYKMRIEMNNEKSGPPVYWAYWGYMQKELLSSLDYTRLSNYSKELLSVVNRNKWIRGNHYHAHSPISPAKSVCSPLHGHSGNISDKTWLKIISTPSEKMRLHSWKESSNYYVEANHPTFSTDFRIETAKDPVHFIKLALRIPEGLPQSNMYISAVFSGIKHTKCENWFDMDLVEKLISKHQHASDASILRGICEIVEAHSEEPWADSVIDVICNIASSSNPSFDLYKRPDDSAHSLYTASLNSAQGCALFAIASLLFEHPDWLDKFRNTLLITANSTNPATRFATTACARACYNADPKFSEEMFICLLKQDLSVITFNHIWDIIFRTFPNNEVFYRERLILGCSCGDSEIEEISGQFCCALAIYYSDDTLLSHVINAKFPHHTEKGICAQAAHTFGYDEYRDISKTIILSVAEKTEHDSRLLGYNFFHKDIVVSRDHDFLESYFNTAVGRLSASDLLDAMAESSEDISCITNILKVISEHILVRTEKYLRPNYTKDLIQCVLKAFDTGKDDPIVCQNCLDIWDTLFKLTPENIRRYTDMLDALE